MKASKKILITGGAGFIGSNLSRYLFKKYPNYKIIVLDALTYAGSTESIPQEMMHSNRYEFIHGNIRNGNLVEALVAKSDVVVHMAAESHVTRSIYSNTEFFETDVIGTHFVANAVIKHAKKIKKFIHISTSEVYGTAETKKMNENHPLNPMSPYAAAKCGADRLVYSYWKTYKIPIVIIRPFNNYGPNQHLEKVVPRFITSCILGEPLRVHGNGSAARDFLHVQDHCEALDKVMHAPSSKVQGRIFNIGTGIDTSVLQIARTVKKIMGSKSPILKISNRPGQVFRHTCDYSLIRKTLNWEPKIGFEEGLKTTINWYVQNRHWWETQLWLRNIPIENPDGKTVWH